LSIKASNGQVPDATQNFTLTVHEASAISSAAATSFTVGKAKTFTITTTGFPKPTLSESGPLPSGVTFVDHGDGTGALEGMPASGSGGTYDVTISASNGVGGVASQNLSVTVNPATQSATITSASSTTFAAGTAGSFLVSATGQSTPVLSESGALPPGVKFTDNGNGTATIAGTPSATAAGTYQLTITATDGAGPAATQVFDLHVAIATPPKVVRFQRVKGRTPARFVLTFDEPMDQVLAQTLGNYVFRPVVRSKVLHAPRQAIHVKSAMYDSARETVTLVTVRPIKLAKTYQITVNGAATNGLANVSGVALDGKGNGRPGSDFVITFTGQASMRGIPRPATH
jgi:hypothetical protein